MTSHVVVRADGSLASLPMSRREAEVIAVSMTSKACGPFFVSHVEETRCALVDMRANASVAIGILDDMEPALARAAE